MRLLVDEHGMDWEPAWDDHAARRSAYTNHTLLPEALESGRSRCSRKVLPRHLEIIYEINAASSTRSASRFSGDEARIARMSLIDENGEPLCAHGASRLCRQPCRERRGGRCTASW